jgi:hypothetical protein
VYRTIETSIWFDPKFTELPAPGKLLFLYLITNPHAHVSGIYYLPEEVVRRESGLKADSLDRLWDTLSESGLSFRDRIVQIVWVKNMLRHQGGHSKLIAAAANHVGTLHNSELVKKFLDYYPDVKKAAAKRSRHRVSGSRLQEQEQEQDQKKKGAAPPVAEVGDDGATITAETVYRAYPKHVEPEPSKQAIAKAVLYLRKTRGISTPWAWLLGKVRLYAEARETLERNYPGASRFVPACHRWVRKKRYDEDPDFWPKEVPGFAVTRAGANGSHRPSRDDAEAARAAAAFSQSR